MTMERPKQMPPAVLDMHNTKIAQEVCNLMASAYAAEARLLGATNFPPLQRAREGNLNTEAAYVGIRCVDRLVAAVEIENGCDGGKVIAALVVRPDRFRQGLGQRLLHHILGKFGGCRIDVSTARDNEPARALYTKAGFRHISHWNTADGWSMVTLRRDGASAP